MFFPSLRTTGVSSCLCGRSSDERNSFVFACERFCSFSSLRVAIPLVIKHRLTDLFLFFQIDDERMSLISLDRKSIILEKTHKEISYCTQVCLFM